MPNGLEVLIVGSKRGTLEAAGLYDAITAFDEGQGASSEIQRDRNCVKVASSRCTEYTTGSSVSTAHHCCLLQLKLLREPNDAPCQHSSAQRTRNLLLLRPASPKNPYLCSYITPLMFPSSHTCRNLSLSSTSPSTLP